MIQKLLFLLCCMLVSTVGFSKGLSVKQAESIDIAGIKIGMTEQQAINIITRKYNITENKLTIKKVKNNLTGKRQTSYIDFNNNGEQITVGFDVDVSTQPYKLVVFEVYYRLPDTAENKKAMSAVMQKKYGKESFIGMSGNKTWCNMTKNQCTPETTILTFSQSYTPTVTMKNSKYSQAQNRLQQSQQNRKPNF